MPYGRGMRARADDQEAVEGTRGAGEPGPALGPQPDAAVPGPVQAEDQRVRREVVAADQDELLAGPGGGHAEPGERRALGEGPRSGRRTVGDADETGVAGGAGAPEGPLQGLAERVPDVVYSAVLRASALFPIELWTLKLTASER